MNNNTKAGVGISGLGALLFIFHLIHVFQSASEIGGNDKKETFKNAPVYFIQTDSTGKKDTMMMEDYLKNRK